MKKYIDAEQLSKKIESIGLYAQKSADYNDGRNDMKMMVLDIIDSLQQEQLDMGEVSDGYHTFNELYYYRMLYNAAFFNLLPMEWVHKSKRHHTGEECFGGGWFIVMANLPTGQVSNHYELKDWDLFKVPEKEFADEWDGHTPQEAAERIHKYLQQEQPIEYIRKDIADEMVELAEDHAYFAGQEKLREKLLEWAKERQAYYCKRADDIDDDSNHEMVYFYGKESAFRELIGKIESL